LSLPRRRLVLLILCLTIGHAAVQQNPTKVTMQDLLTRPADFEGKLIEVRGFLLQEFENSALYSSQAWRYSKQAVWVTPSAEMVKQREKLNRRYVLLTGIFDAHAHGHMGQFKGTLKVEIFQFVGDDAGSSERKSSNKL
jgi:hypothetical protein